MNYLHYDDISYAHTRQWECSLNKAEEWANKLYQRYPNVDRVLINQVVARANDMHINNYEELESLLLQNIRRG